MYTSGVTLIKHREASPSGKDATEAGVSAMAGTEAVSFCDRDTKMGREVAWSRFDFGQKKKDWHQLLG